MPTQRKLILPGEPAALVLLTIEAARAQLPGHTEDDILALIEEGHIEWAWNIGLGQSREIRIWPLSLAAAINPKSTGCELAHQDPATVMLGDKPFIRGHDLRICWNCSSTHIIALLTARQLEVLPNTRWGVGPQGTPLITSTSIRTFLTDRRIC